MRPVVREAILNGTRAASDTHRAFRIRELVESQGGSVDVFGTIHELGIPLYFKPLDKLLGACVRLSAGLVGILVTTERDLHLQRFTGAHEFGHFVLEHRASLDDEKNVQLPGKGQDRDPQEIEADAFASEFLMPKWICRDVARRHGWRREDLAKPLVVYQMSLRLAVSYAAMCWGLASQNLITFDAARALESVAPKTIKRGILRDVALDDPWADVWLVGPGDSSVQLALGPTDLVVLELKERSGAGYLWNRNELEDEGFAIIRDERTPATAGTVGGPTARRLIARAPVGGRHEVRLSERRPWAGGGAPLSEFELCCSSDGKQREGEFSREAQPAIATVAEARH